jgi:hypothetical protein
MQFAAERSPQTNATSRSTNRLNEGSLVLAARTEHSTVFAALSHNTERNFFVLLIA